MGRLSLFISVTGLMLRKFVMGYVRLGWCGLVPSRAIWLLMAFLLRFHTRVRPLNVTFVGSWAILQKIVLCVASVWSAGNPGISSGIVQCVCVGFKGLWIVLILFLWVMPRAPPPQCFAPGHGAATCGSLWCPSYCPVG